MNFKFWQYLTGRSQTTNKFSQNTLKPEEKETPTQKTKIWTLSELIDAGLDIVAKDRKDEITRLILESEGLHHQIWQLDSFFRRGIGLDSLDINIFNHPYHREESFYELLKEGIQDFGGLRSSLGFRSGDRWSEDRYSVSTLDGKNEVRLPPQTGKGELKKILELLSILSIPHNLSAKVDENSLEPSTSLEIDYPSWAGIIDVKSVIAAHKWARDNNLSFHLYSASYDGSTIDMQDYQQGELYLSVKRFRYPEGLTPKDVLKVQDFVAKASGCNWNPECWKVKDYEPKTTQKQVKVIGQ